MPDLDAAKLDEIERTVRQRETIWRAMNAVQGHVPAADVTLAADEARLLLAAAREAIALRADCQRLVDCEAAAEHRAMQAEEREAVYRALIVEHNAGCMVCCDARTPEYCAPFLSTSKGRCPDCPRLDMIELPIAEGGK